MKVQFEQLGVKERSRFCEVAAERLGLPASSIEKDYWVCWTLRALFATPGDDAGLTFKGGTSLAKGWDLIDRFSEDIDIVIDRAALGFGGESGPMAASISNKERARRVERLQLAAGMHVEQVILPGLRAALRSQVQGHADWSVELDRRDTQRQSILLEYPTQLQGAYVRNVVLVELGARSDTDPRELIRVRSYLAKALANEIDEPENLVLTVRPERTFWEKVMLLHEESFRQETHTPKGRMSRHLYDVVRLGEAGFAQRAVEDVGLFERIAEHRRIFFPRNRAAHETLSRGSLILVPEAERESWWRDDYRRMRDAMFWREPPTFDNLLEALRRIEAEVNAPA